MAGFRGVRAFVLSDSIAGSRCACQRAAGAGSRLHPTIMLTSWRVLHGVFCCRRLMENLLVWVERDCARMEKLYEGLALGEKDGDLEQGRWNQYRKDRKAWLIEQIQVAIGMMWLIASFLLTIRFANRWVSSTLCDRDIHTNGVRVFGSAPSHNTTCSTVEDGYRCFPSVSHLWGPYSPYFAVEDEPGLSSAIPAGCQVTFAQVLSRHGARYPTDSKGDKYSDLIAGIKTNATSLKGKYAFIDNYTYTLGENDLTEFGKRQLVDSGMKFYRRYKDLARTIVPFMRSSGSERVVASAEKFIEGFQHAKGWDSSARHNQTIPVISVVMGEGEQFNNTLDHGSCPKFEDSTLGLTIKQNYTDVFAPAIRERLEADIPGITLSNTDVTYLMDICAFDTVARTPQASELSPFCNLFTNDEWPNYNYLLSLEKYYSYGAGNPLGPAQGIGYTNELIARLTQTPVHDHTSSNKTLDSNPDTFPLHTSLYADFSHDNAMTSIFFAMGLYHMSPPPSLHEVESAPEMDGYSAAWGVPFAARAYVEMMQCEAQREPLVRVLVNDRVVPLRGCHSDQMGRCKRDDFVRGLGFAQSGGNWDSCYSS